MLPVRDHLRILRLGVIFFSCCGCEPREGDESTSVSATVVSQAAVEERLRLVENMFAEDDVCFDFRLAQGLIRFLHHGPAGSDDGPCPASFSEFASRMRSSVAALRDLHSRVLFGRGLDASAGPVVAESDQAILGSPIVGVESPVQDAWYSLIISEGFRAVPIRVDRVDGADIAVLREELQSDIFYSHTGTNWSQVLPSYVLQREALDQRSRAPVHIEGRNLKTLAAIDVVGSFDDRQTIFVPTRTHFGVYRAYGCSDVFPGSREEQGACVTHGHPLLWLSSWPQRDSGFRAWVDAAFSWLEGKGDTRLFLDLRGNKGGSPKSVADFLCMVGGHRAASIMDELRLSIRTWPISIPVRGQAVMTSDLKTAHNGDLILRGEIQEPETTEIGYLERVNLSVTECGEMESEAARRYAVTVIADGSEFSASEEFMHMAKQLGFDIFGRPTPGGAGNPIWIELPRTKTRLRLSTSRLIEGGRVIIEGEGVEPTEFFEFETQEEFEGRIYHQIEFPFAPETAFLPRSLEDLLDKNQ